MSQTDWKSFITDLQETKQVISEGPADSYPLLVKQYNAIDKDMEKLRQQRNKIALQIKDIESSLRRSMKMTKTQSGDINLEYNGQIWKVKDRGQTRDGHQYIVTSPSGNKGNIVSRYLNLNSIRLKIATTNGKWNPAKETEWDEPHIEGPEYYD